MSTKIKEVSLLKDTKFLKMYNIDYYNKNNTQKAWSAVSRKDLYDYKKSILSKNASPDAVVIVPYHIKEDKLVLVKQFRIPINDYIYEIPAGLLEKDEPIEECAKRELKEETGLDLIEITKVFKNIYVSPGMTDESLDIVFCNCQGEISDEFMEEDEDIEIVMLSQNEVDNILENNSKMDIKTLFALELFKNIGNIYWQNNKINNK